MTDEKENIERRLFAALREAVVEIEYLAERSARVSDKLRETLTALEIELQDSEEA